MGVAIFEGQGVLGSGWTQLPETGPLTVGVFIMSPASDNMAVSLTGTGTPAIDGTGDGVIAAPYTPALFFPVADASALYVGEFQVRPIAGTDIKERNP